MLVDIQYGTEKAGFFTSKVWPYIHLRVQFSEDEKSIIKEKELNEYTFYEAPLFEGLNARCQVPIPIRQLLDGRPLRIHYNDKTALESGDIALRHALKELKEIISIIGARSTKPGTYEI